MRIVVLLCFAAATMSGASANRCCISQKFSGLTMRLQTTLPTGTTDPMIQDVYSLLDYDADVKMERTAGHRLDLRTGTRQSYTVYKDFKQLKMYTVTPSGCKLEYLNEIMIPPCVAANFTLLQQYTISSGHTRHVSITAWEGPYLGTLWMNIHFIDHTCELMAINIYGRTPDRAAELLHTYKFADMKQGQLRSHDVFTLPDSCKHVS